MPDPTEGQPKHTAAEFQTTHWSVVIAARGQGQAELRSAALSQLCQTYWMPLYWYARRRVGDVHQAQDLTQSFFERLLEKNYLASADPNRGQFRAFLITAFKHFLSNERARAQAQKRGGGQTVLSLDFESADAAFALHPSENLTADQLFDRQWAITLLNEVSERLGREQERAGKGRQFLLLKGFMVRESDGTSYAEVARELGVTPSAARMTASRLRRRYRELLRQEIAQTVATEADIDDEIHQLFAILSN